ncbi:MAG: undecaprenyldiphospho-muramoylpentapeptide beta-N-acetylglucosaminyltransferase [Desulfobacterales bacterium]|nr:undecaprenyldiphospho-muramoylpentapeptide beta-N-acetylglucosaminyltransferase [Desulfobacterales bacterium]
MTRFPINILIAAGGTGGHLFPAVTIAQAFKDSNPENRICFVCTGKPFERSVLVESGFDFYEIKTEGLKGRGIINQFKSAFKIPMGILKSMGLISRIKPDLVIGMGSYVAGPVLLAAWVMGKKTAIHEQNILPGVTNRILSRFAQRIMVSYEDTKTNAAPEKVRVTGNPVRKEILSLLNEESSSRSIDSPMTILVMGGSQGAHNINMAVIESLEHIKDKDVCTVIHQTGSQDEEMVKRAYVNSGIKNTVKAFFKDMDRQYKTADLLICRSGATTVAELAAIGKAAIFVPFPHAADNHQEFNARSLEENGAAEMILEKDLSGRTIADRITYYASNRDKIVTMAENARKLGKPDAAQNIIDLCYEVVEAGRLSKAA